MTIHIGRYDHVADAYVLRFEDASRHFPNAARVVVNGETVGIVREDKVAVVRDTDALTFGTGDEFAHVETVAGEVRLRRTAVGTETETPDGGA